MSNSGRIVGKSDMSCAGMEHLPYSKAGYYDKWGVLPPFEGLAWLLLIEE